MGAVESQERAFPALTGDELNMLTTATKYSSEEILALHSQFYSSLPSGAIDYAVFTTALRFFGISDGVVTKALFRGFDANGDGLITFSEFTRSMSVMTRGTNAEKIQLAFEILDVHQQGLVTMQTVIPLLEGLQGVVKRFTPYHEGRSAGAAAGVEAQDVASLLFHRQSAMTREEFRELVRTSDFLLKGLALR